MRATCIAKMSWSAAPLRNGGNTSEGQHGPDVCPRVDGTVSLAASSIPGAAGGTRSSLRREAEDHVRGRGFGFPEIDLLAVPPVEDADPPGGELGEIEGPVLARDGLPEEQVVLAGSHDPVRDCRLAVGGEESALQRGPGGEPQDDIPGTRRHVESGRA